MHSFPLIPLILAISLGGALTQEGTKAPTFVGKISDNMCGLTHSGMGGKSDKECTLACVKKMDGEFVLADEANKVVYQLDDQKTPEQFAGQAVKVTGTLDTKSKTIQVKTIEPIKEEKP